MNKKFFAALASATMAFTASGSIAVFADDFVEEGSHNYTTDKAENDHLVSLGWIYEGTAWNAKR